MPQSIRHGKNTTEEASGRNNAIIMLRACMHEIVAEIFFLCDLLIYYYSGLSILLNSFWSNRLQHSVCIQTTLHKHHHSEVKRIDWFGKSAWKNWSDLIWFDWLVGLHIYRTNIPSIETRLNYILSTYTEKKHFFLSLSWTIWFQ